LRGYDNFFCGLCKKSKSKQQREKLIFYDVSNNVLTVSDTCRMCFIAVKGVINSRPLSEKQLTLLSTMGIEN